MQEPQGLALRSDAPSVGPAPIPVALVACATQIACRPSYVVYLVTSLSSQLPHRLHCPVGLHLQITSSRLKIIKNFRMATV